MNNNKMNKKESIFYNKEKFIKETMFSSTNLIPDIDFINENITNKNLMFFLNCVIDILSSISMLGCRNMSFSLIGKINNIIDYYDSIIDLYDKPKMAKSKIDYVLNSIKNNTIIDENAKKKYLTFVSTSNDQELIENLKLILQSLIDNAYFKTTYEKLKQMLLDSNFDDYNKFYIFINEYFSLLNDYIGVSVYELKRLIKDAYREYFNSHDENVFISMLDKLTFGYLDNREYVVFVKMDKDFDEKLLNSLKNSQNNNYIIYSKTGFDKRINDEKIYNRKNLEQIIKDYINDSDDNHFFISNTIYAKDIWYAIRDFRQKTIQPFIGTMLYAGINVSPIDDYIVIYGEEENKYINSYRYFDDIFKPLSQDRIDYSDVFKRYIIENSNNDINKIIDEAVQLLPYYKKSDSILIKFTNTWFALETLFRNSSEIIINGLIEYASYLVADRMLAGIIYVTAVQIKKICRTKYKKLSNNFVENSFLNIDDVLNRVECGYLKWKYKMILDIINNYEKMFDNKLLEAKELLDNAYRLRNKQFHGTKDSKLEKMSGFLYDIVNDTIAFYIDYLDVYKDCEPNSKSLFNIIKNTKNLKSTLIKEEDNTIKKISILYDSVRRI